MKAKKTFRWIAGILLMIGGIALLAYDVVIPGALCLVVGLVVLPWTRSSLPNLMHPSRKDDQTSE